MDLVLQVVRTEQPNVRSEATNLAVQDYRPELPDAAALALRAFHLTGGKQPLARPAILTSIPPKRWNAAFGEQSKSKSKVQWALSPFEPGEVETDYAKNFGE